MRGGELYKGKRRGGNGRLVRLFQRGKGGGGGGGGCEVGWGSQGLPDWFQKLERVFG